MSDSWDKLDEHTRAILDGHGGEGVVAVQPSLVREFAPCEEMEMPRSWSWSCFFGRDDWVIPRDSFFSSRGGWRRRPAWEPMPSGRLSGSWYAWACLKPLAEGCQPDFTTASICTGLRHYFSKMVRPCQLPTIIGNKIPAMG